MGGIVSNDSTRKEQSSYDNIIEIKENLDIMSIEELFKEIESALKMKYSNSNQSDKIYGKYGGVDFFIKKLFNKISLLNRSLTPKRITAWVFAPEFIRKLLILNFNGVIK